MNGPTTLFLSKGSYDVLYQKAVNDYPYETCGFLIGTKGYFRTVFKLKSATNQSTERNRFQIDPFDFYTLEKSLEKSHQSIIGFYHSHPDGRAQPSSIDVALAWPDYSYIIVALNSDYKTTLRSWQIDVKEKECIEEPIIMY